MLLKSCAVCCWTLDKMSPGVKGKKKTGVIFSCLPISVRSADCGGHASHLALFWSVWPHPVYVWQQSLWPDNPGLEQQQEEKILCELQNGFTLPYDHTEKWSDLILWLWGHNPARSWCGMNWRKTTDQIVSLFSALQVLLHAEGWISDCESLWP